MFGWLKIAWRTIAERRRVSSEISSKAFRDMAREISELAAMAGQLGPVEDEFQAKLRRIRTEMDQLGCLAEKPEFRRLSRKRRLLLRRGLLQSRDQLLETVRSAPTPTSRIQ